MTRHLSTSPTSIAGSVTATITGVLAAGILLSGCGSSEPDSASTFVSHDGTSATA
ncbi:MAG: hypothetical protein QOE58_3561, partial [Actinomycetota bacterium]|nr:hypothetical protein [Actinomycetota bacterium]